MLPSSDEYYLAFAQHVVHQGGRRALARFRHSSGWQKENATTVTQTDLDIQSEVERAVAERFPSHAVLGEEQTGTARPTGKEPWLWIVDPIDGTDSFAGELPVWGISLALFHDGKPRVGVFHLPLLGETYTATADGDATLLIRNENGEEEVHAIHVNPDPALNDRSVLCVPSDFHRHFQSIFPGKQRCLGSLAAHICLVARGQAYGAIQNPYIWDVAATALILERAGGRLLHYDSQEPVELSRYLDGSRLPVCLAVPSQTNYQNVKNLVTRR